MATIGQTIKTIRQNLAISQLELEEKLELSTGSLTKIESDKVIPKRETLLKIIEVLNLNPFESFQLIGMPSSKIIEIITLINQIHTLNNVEEIAQKAVDEIPQKLGLLGASLNLVFKDNLKTVAFTKSWYTDLLLKILPFPYKDFSVSLSKDSHNLMVKSILKGKLEYNEKLSEFTSPFMTPGIANLLQKTANVKSILCIPLTVGDFKIGCILYVKNNKMEFSNEIPILNAITASVATAIFRLQKK